MVKEVFTTNPEFEDLLRDWLNEWNKWCKDTHERYGEAAPQGVIEQQLNFRIWVARQKNVVVFDSSERKK